MILLIDNYDSFSYNLYQLIGSIEPQIKVIRNDELNIMQIKEIKPTLIVLSPGPKKPQDSGICIEVIKKLGSEIPIFGVCLGHQAICVAFGGEVSYAQKIMHGKTSMIEVDPTSVLFNGLGETIQVARYHSLISTKIPQSLKITATTKEHEIMALEHKVYPIYGVQFHPESILTPLGKKIIQNVLYSTQKRESK
ncbi:aminodeoxychorismate/anthranilate synthase component II [Helicobacter sp. MIT 99-5507]|uniref:anthranilate synthase component II n=1 Tax=Helicobacter sp. MIT 99-5507 TaxID=152489 RepID=UPI000E1ECB91|nr:aminodeoxychorismate/anthranilate synthase component II [Helicobacter sp. MIT 99-5507]RDU58486.1 aminodeoxychorismate/anthranilate synthase component II [Helicobacter sp. MIT 99-5507]